MKASKILSVLLAGVVCVNLMGAIPPWKAEAAEPTTATYPIVHSYTAGNGQFSLGENARIYVLSNSETLENEDLQEDLKLMSSEFAAKNLTGKSMDIVYGTVNGIKAGDIAVAMEEIKETENAEGYKIEIGDYAKVTAANEDGIFYGMRTIQKALIANDGSMDQGTIVDYPAVAVRSFHLDTARKEFTKDWIVALIKDLSYQNYNSLQFHFSENEGFRLECETLEKAVSGFKYSSGYFTKEDMLDIIHVCDQYHIELIPSMDSPGHMGHVLNQLPAEYRCTNLFPTDDRKSQTFNIFEKEEARQLLKDMFTEYAEFFSKAGCKHMNIGGDEFLAKFSSMTNEQYLQVIDYFNAIAKIVEDHGMTPRAWSDGLMFGDFTGYKLDPKIEICYWSGPASCASVKKFTDNGNKVINYSDAYMYYVLAWWWMNYANPSAQRIYEEWHPGKLPSLSGQEQVYEYPYTDDSFLGASFALWCDTPSYMTPDQVSENIFMRTRATAEKCWNPGTTRTYSQLETVATKLQHVAGYDGELPAPGNISYDGELGTLTVRYQDEKGNEIKAEDKFYGAAGESYQVAIPQIYGYQYVKMDKSESGKYTKEDIVVTLTYKMVTDKNELKKEVEGALKASDYIPQTFTAYAEALENALKVINNEDADQTTVDEALEALRTAAADVVAMSKLSLYIEVMLPVASAGYTAESYAAYTRALSAARDVLYNQEAGESDIEQALEAIRTAKAGLTENGGSGIQVSSNMGTYVEDSKSYPLSNMLDKDRTTYAWTNEAQKAGDNITFTFPKPVILSSVQIQAPEDAGSDHFYGADVEVSADGSTWENVGSIGEELDTTITLDSPKQVQYVKLTITREAENWLKIAEASFVYTEIETADKTELEKEIEGVLDMDLSPYTRESVSGLVDALVDAARTASSNAASKEEVSSKLQKLQEAVAALQETEIELPFVDIPNWGSTDIKGMIGYLYGKGLMTGYKNDPTKFGSMDQIVRGDFALVLYRMYCMENGEKEKTIKEDGPLAENPFPDVAKDVYYAYAVKWASENKIVTGYTSGAKAGCFDPLAYINREQVAVMLYRYAKFMDEKLIEGADENALEGFADKDLIQPYSDGSGLQAMKWAVSVGIMQGMDKTTLNPLGGAVRAQAAAMFYRYLHQEEWNKN